MILNKEETKCSLIMYRRQRKIAFIHKTIFIDHKTDNNYVFTQIKVCEELDLKAYDSNRIETF